MGTCLAVVKVIGTTTLGLYTGIVTANALSGGDILIRVLTNSTITDFHEINGLVKDKIKENSIVLTILGALSTTAFQLSYFKAPLSSRHPYLIYSSLVFPISALIYGVLVGKDLGKAFKLDLLLKDIKREVEQKKKNKKEVVKSALDNSIYKDLGDDDDSNSESAAAASAEDEEIEAEVEYHLNKTSSENFVNKYHLASKITSVFSFVGFVIAGTGIYGDF